MRSGFNRYLALALFIVFFLSIRSSLQAQSFGGRDKELNADQVAILMPIMLKQHLSFTGDLEQVRLNESHVRRMIDEFLKLLDPAKNLYLKEEAEIRTTIEQKDLARLTADLSEGKLGHFENWIREFKEKQLGRDRAFMDSLEGYKDKIKERVKGKDLKDIDFKSFPKSEEERQKRILLGLSNLYHMNLDFLSEEEAFVFALQSIRRPRQRFENYNPSTKVPAEVMKAFMSALDPHSEYMDPEQTESFQAGIERNFAGIGVQIRGCPLGAHVVEVIHGGPAYKSQMFKSGDQIVGVDGKSVAGMPLNDIVRMIKGEKGSKVKLAVKKPAADGEESKIVTIDLVRDTIELADLRVKGDRIETDAGVIGVIKVENFYQGVHGDVVQRLNEMKTPTPLAGLVLDLRYNSGGLLEEAVRMAGLFIGQGPIVAEGRTGVEAEDWRYDPDTDTVFDGPLVVLVNQFSASASEIVSGSLKDYGRAIVVGPTQTHGKGTVQRVLDLLRYGIPGRFRITINQYFLAGGDSVQLRGVEPDIRIPGRSLMEEILESQYDNAIPWSSTKSALSNDHPDVKRFKTMKENTLELLKSRSELRAALNSDFDGYRAFAKAEAEYKQAKAEGRELPEPDDPDDKKTNSAQIAPENPEEEITENGKKNLKDPQRDEAVAIVSDMLNIWTADSNIARLSDELQKWKIEKQAKDEAEKVAKVENKDAMLNKKIGVDEKAR